MNDYYITTLQNAADSTVPSPAATTYGKMSIDIFNKLN